mgnify:CR=1 FL=1
MTSIKYIADTQRRLRELTNKARRTLPLPAPPKGFKWKIDTSWEGEGQQVVVITVNATLVPIVYTSDD